MGSSLGQEERATRRDLLSGDWNGAEQRGGAVRDCVYDDVCAT
jgi:hypothetical protein